MKFPKELLGGVWHTTNIERFQQILKDKAILPEPPTINNPERWKTENGPESYPFVRKIGGVSLFDFRNFDANEYPKNYPCSSWRKFVPRLSKWKTVVWIEINIKAVLKNLIFGYDLIEQWKKEQAHNHTIMPIIEIAHIGPLQTSAFKQILKYSVEAPYFKRIDEE